MFLGEQPPPVEDAGPAQAAAAGSAWCDGPGAEIRKRQRIKYCTNQTHQIGLLFAPLGPHGDSMGVQHPHSL